MQSRSSEQCPISKEKHIGDFIRFVFLLQVVVELFVPTIQVEAIKQRIGAINMTKEVTYLMKDREPPGRDAVRFVNFDTIPRRRKGIAY